MALVNSYIVYSKLTQNKLSHYAFNVAVAKGLIGNYNSRKRNPLTFRSSKRSSSNFPAEIPLHLPELEPSRGRCHCFKNEGKTEHSLNVTLVGYFYAWLLLLLAEIAVINIICKFK